MGCWRFQTASCCICLRSAGKRPFLNIAVLVVPSVWQFVTGRRRSGQPSALLNTVDRCQRWPQTLHSSRVVTAADGPVLQHLHGLSTCVQFSAKLSPHLGTTSLEIHKHVCVMCVCVVAWNVSLELGESAWQVLIVTSVVEAIPKHSYCKGYTRFCTWQKMLSLLVAVARTARCQWCGSAFVKFHQVQKCSCTL